jgi:hypothetical protein
MSNIVARIPDTDNVQMSNVVARIPNQAFPFMRLPVELRQNVYRYLVIKPDSYIGQFDKHGVSCAIGQAQANIYNAHAFANFSTAIAMATSFEEVHEPVGCLHPTHELKQIHQDFHDYRCINFALTCRQVNEEIREVFFKENGFALQAGQDLMQWFLLIGNRSMNLITKLRLFHYIDMSKEDFQVIFGDLPCSATFHSLVENNYLQDDAAGSAIVQVLSFIQRCKNIKDFELVYRLEIPGHFFADEEAAETSIVLDELLFYAHHWVDKNMQWDVRTKNVLEKLRQADGVRALEVIRVEGAAFERNLLADEVAMIVNERDLFSEYAGALGRVCINHAESCIESAGARGRNRIMEVP